MKNILACVIAAALALGGCSARHHQPSAQARLHSRAAYFTPVLPDTSRNAFVVHNLIYSQDHASIEQTLDLYIPAAVKPPYKVILWVHGGSWMYGDKNADCLACNCLLDKYAVASINYRLDNRAPFPAQINDLKAAVRFLRAKAKIYKLDPNLVGVWGTSAGGHLAALLGTAADDKSLEGDEGNKKYSSQVQAVCDWCGPTDFNSAQSQAGRNCKIKFTGRSSPVFVLMGGKMDQDSLAKASPVTYVSKQCPPFLIMHGEDDDAIPPLQSKELYDRLKRAGCDATLLLIPGYGHALGSAEHMKIVKEFFDAKLQSPKSK